MWPYIITFVAVAVFPLALAGYGGHLALALPENPQRKRRALMIVWGLAIAGILLFGVSQVYAYRTDRAKDDRDDNFRTDVLGKLQKIIDEPNIEKKMQEASMLKQQIAPSGSNGHIPTPRQPSGKAPEGAPFPSMSNDEIRKEVREVTTHLTAVASAYNNSQLKLDFMTQRREKPPINSNELQREFEQNESNIEYCARANYFMDIVEAKLAKPARTEKLFRLDQPHSLLYGSDILQRMTMQLPL